MLTGNKIDAIIYRARNSQIVNREGDSRSVSFPSRDFVGQKAEENRGFGRRGIRGLGDCGHPSSPWPLTHILEETDEYILACCDAGCATILAKKPPRKIVRKKKSRRESKLIRTLDGNLVPERQKGLDSNTME